MTTIFARRALLADGWAESVRLEIEGGRLRSVARGIAPAGDLECGIVIPGVVNAHSHAFQRALAGRTEFRSMAGADTFWTWRRLMYRLSARLDADTLRAIAAELYAEMLASGYTAVVEFHYLLGGRAENRHAEDYLDALALAAADTGIRLTYVPVLYERGGFGDEPLDSAQAGFALPVEEFLAHFERARARAQTGLHVGLGAHSLRAVRPASLAAIVERAAAADVPLHIHVAEQRREVEACTAHYQRRPVRWLLENFDVDRRWTLVHATHMDADETARLGASGAVVCLCPSTEANLGDGVFGLRAFLDAGGTIAIGSDSHVTVNPYEELRWLEYGQRLATMQRNVSAVGSEAHSGAGLYQRAVAGGAVSAGLEGDALEVGACADLVVLDDEHPMLVGHESDTVLDALVFSGISLPIDRVMVAGRWCIENGRHPAGDGYRRAYRRALESLSLHEVLSG
jgi:formimidoylglutamate deiminase